MAFSIDEWIDISQCDSLTTSQVWESNLEKVFKVEELKTVNDHYWCTGLGVEWFLCGTKMTNYKSGGSKRI